MLVASLLPGITCCLVAVFVLLISARGSCALSATDTTRVVESCYGQDAKPNDYDRLLKDRYPESVFRIIAVAPEASGKSELLSGTAVLIQTTKGNDKNITGYFLTADHNITAYSGWTFKLRRWDGQNETMINVKAIVAGQDRGLDAAVLKADLTSVSTYKEDFSPVNLRLGLLLGNRTESTLIAYDGADIDPISRQLSAKYAVARASTVGHVVGTVMPGNSGAVPIDEWGLGIGVVQSFEVAELDGIDKKTVEVIYKELKERENVKFTPISQLHQLLMSNVFVSPDKIHSLIDLILSDPGELSRKSFKPLTQFEFLRFLYELLAKANEGTLVVQGGTMQDLRDAQRVIDDVADKFCLLDVEGLEKIRFALVENNIGKIRESDNRIKILQDDLKGVRPTFRSLMKGGFDDDSNIKEVVKNRLKSHYDFAVTLFDNLSDLSEREKKYFGYVLAEGIQLNQGSPAAQLGLAVRAFDVDPTNPVLLDNARLVFRENNKPGLAAYATALAASSGRPNLDRTKLWEDYRTHLELLLATSQSPETRLEAKELAAEVPWTVDLGRLKTLALEGMPAGTSTSTVEEAWQPVFQEVIGIYTKEAVGKHHSPIVPYASDPGADKS